MDGRWNGTVWSDRARSRSDNDPASMDESVDKVESHRRLLTVRESLGLAYISGGIAVGSARREDVNSVYPTLISYPVIYWSVGLVVSPIHRSMPPAKLCRYNHPA